LTRRSAGGYVPDRESIMSRPSPAGAAGAQPGAPDEGSVLGLFATGIPLDSDHAQLALVPAKTIRVRLNLAQPSDRRPLPENPWEAGERERDFIEALL
jgi:hypothetical protein